MAVQCLFHLAEVCDTFVYRTVTRLLAGDIEECFWISHIEIYNLAIYNLQSLCPFTMYISRCYYITVIRMVIVHYK